MRILSATAVAMVATLAVAQSPLTTTYLNNNGGSVGGGVYYDLTVTTPAGVTITGLDVNVSGSGSIEVWGILGGTRTGNQTNQTAWSLLSGGTVSGGIAGAATPVTGLTPIALPSGTHGIALKAVGVSHNYTNGNGANQTVSTAELTLNAGEASNTAFVAPLFTPRVPNTTITYSNGTSGTLASRVAYGTGCIRCLTSIYENFATAAAFDLNGAAVAHLLGAVVVPGTTPFTAPGAGAVALALADNSEIRITLGNPFPLPCGGVATQLQVCSNGFVSTASNGIGSTPSVPAMLSATNTGWWCWHDFDPAAGGQVLHEIVGTEDVITWNNVPDAGGVGTNTWQIAFGNGGSVEWRFQSMSATGRTGFLLGYSPGGPSVDPGSTDFSALLSTQLCCADMVPLTLAASARPVIGTNVGMITSNIPAGSAFGAIFYGFSRFDPGLAIPILPGCVQHNELLFSDLFFAPAATRTTNTPMLNPVMNFLGLVIQAQAAVYTGGNPFVLTSNGVALTLGNL
jgi:hypothetical protein